MFINIYLLHYLGALLGCQDDFPRINVTEVMLSKVKIHLSRVNCSFSKAFQLNLLQGMLSACGHLGEKVNHSS